jgi:uncharacterized coiled-coil protein SlyX
MDDNLKENENSQNSNASHHQIDLESRIDELEIALKVKNAMLDDQNSVISQQKQDISALEEEVHACNDQINELEEDIFGLKKIISDLEKQIESRKMFEKHLQSLVKELSNDLVK